MRLTLGQLKTIIAEGLDNLPPQHDVESRLQSSRFDKDAATRVLSVLDRQLPTSNKLLLLNLSRALQAWQLGKTGFNAVALALDKIYQQPRRPSYSNRSVVGPSGRPRVA